MVRQLAFIDRQYSDNRGLPGIRGNRGHRASPRGDALMEQILENLHTVPPGELSKKIASLSDIRQDKVLEIRRQLTERTYSVADRLDQAMDRLLDDGCRLGRDGRFRHA